MGQRYNTPEFEPLGIPEFDPQLFAANIRATYAKAIIEKLPALFGFVHFPTLF